MLAGAKPRLCRWAVSALGDLETLKAARRSKSDAAGQLNSGLPKSAGVKPVSPNHQNWLGQQAARLLFAPNRHQVDRQRLLDGRLLWVAD